MRGLAEWSAVDLNRRRGNRRVDFLVASREGRVYGRGVGIPQKLEGGISGYSSAAIPGARPRKHNYNCFFLKRDTGTAKQIPYLSIRLPVARLYEGSASFLLNESNCGGGTRSSAKPQSRQTHNCCEK